jgi:hypothetical protein
MFASKSAAAPTPQEASNSGSTLNQKLASDAPEQGRGGNKKVQAAEDDSPEIEAVQPTFITPNITLNVDNTQQSSATVMKMRRDDDGNLIVEKHVAS